MVLDNKLECTKQSQWRFFFQRKARQTFIYVHATRPHASFKMQKASAKKTVYSTVSVVHIYFFQLAAVNEHVVETSRFAQVYLFEIMKPNASCLLLRRSERYYCKTERDIQSKFANKSLEEAYITANTEKVLHTCIWSTRQEDRGDFAPQHTLLRTPQQTLHTSICFTCPNTCLASTLPITRSVSMLTWAGIMRMNEMRTLRFDVRSNHHF